MKNKDTDNAEELLRNSTDCLIKQDSPINRCSNTCYGKRGDTCYDEHFVSDCWSRAGLATKLGHALPVEDN